jgi:Ecdysteroid kinase-like family
VYAARYNEEANEAVIVMEDLTFRGFSVWNKLRPINYSHAHRLMTELGRFHAVSFAMKQHCAAEFEQFKGLTDIMSNSVTAEQWQTMNDLCCDRAIQSLDEHETGKKKRVETLKMNMWNELQRSIDGQLAEPYSVITHGDCWTNNIMYSYKVSFSGKRTFSE